MRKYFLTSTAVRQLRYFKSLSKEQFGMAVTTKYYQDIDKAFEHIANNYENLPARLDLVGLTGLSIYPVRQHYIVYQPLSSGVYIVDLLRQTQDVRNILNQRLGDIQRELENLKSSTKH